jgi:hypothetical protein
MRKQESQHKKSFFITDYPNLYLYILCLRVKLWVGMQVVLRAGEGRTACTMHRKKVHGVSRLQPGFH